MRKMLVIPFATATAVMASCAQVKAPVVATPSAASSAPAGKNASSAKPDLAPAPKPATASFPSQMQDERSPSGVTLPPLPGEDDGFGDSFVPVGPLPGDLRGNLRTPDMPSTLPMSVDGKINSSDF